MILLKIDERWNLNDKETYAVSKKLMSLYAHQTDKYLMQYRKCYYTMKAGDEWRTAMKQLKIENDTAYTIDGQQIKVIQPLDKYAISNHLRGFNTIGVFAPQNDTTKFITFDIDSNNIELSKETTKRLMHVLTTQFHIATNDLHISFSGMKGYHVEIFLNEFIKIDEALNFYYSAMQYMPTTALCKIEFRPTSSMGIKIPLGIHTVTKRRCSFVNKQSFEPLKLDEAIEYLKAIKPISPIHAMKNTNVFQSFEQHSTDLKKLARLAPTGYAESILLDKQLKEKGTRHQATIALATYFYIHEIESETACDTIMSILHNTPLHLFNDEPCIDQWERETNRLVEAIYSGKYKLSNRPVNVLITKHELQSVLSFNTNRRKQVAYAALITSKRYADEEGYFYCTINTFNKLLGDSKSRGLIQNTITFLEDEQYLIRTNKKAIDSKRTALAGHKVYEKMTFKIIEPPFQQQSKKLLVPFSASFNDIKTAAKQAFTEQEIRTIVGSSAYYKYWL